MAEASAPAPAPSPGGPAPTNGTPAGGLQGTAPKPSPKPNGAPRNNGGQFAPKEGAVGAVPQGDPKPVPPAEAPWRFKDKLKVYGEEEDVDLDRETVKQKLQKLRALETKQLREYSQNDAKARRLLQLAETDPDEFYRALGKDPIALARKRLAEEARIGAMTEEEKQIHERDQKIAAYEAKEKERAAADKDEKAKAAKARMVEGFRGKVSAALKAVAPELGDTYEAMEAVVHALKLQLEPGLGLEQVDPAELARDAIKQRHDQMRAWAGRMDGATLTRELGKEAVEKLLQHSLAEFDKGQTFDGPPAARPNAPPSERPQREILDEREVNRRLAALRSAR